MIKHTTQYWQGEYVQQSRNVLNSDHFLSSQDLSVWFSGDTVIMRNQMLVTCTI